MNFNKILFEQIDGLGIITFNNPEERNVIASTEMDKELEQCLDICAVEPEIKVIVIKGAGPHFSAGGDVKKMERSFETGEFKYGFDIKELGRIITKIRTIRKPVIASIHGAAAGGGLSIALACDFRIAALDTKFVFAFSNIGLAPDMGASLTLTQLVGPAKATELMMTGKLFSGKEAHEWGIVHEAVPLSQLEETTMDLAKKLAEGPTLAYGAIKSLVNHVSYKDLPYQIDLEGEFQELLSNTEDHKEGVTAFLQKRKPKFKGK